MEEVPGIPHGPPINILPTPAGLESLYSLCRRIYPDQVNPLQVTALLKYWYDKKKTSHLVTPLCSIFIPLLPVTKIT